MSSFQRPNCGGGATHAEVNNNTTNQTQLTTSVKQLTSHHRSRSVISLQQQPIQTVLTIGQQHHQQPHNHHHQHHHNLSSKSSPSSSSSPEYSTPIPSGPSFDELEQVAAFYRSHRTMLFVGQCIVGLYFTETELVDGGRISRPRREDWKLAANGIPVLILNRGDVKSRDKRQIQIYIAERGSGMPLWSDVIDGLSGYCADEKTFHTMYLSDDHRKMAGLLFDCPVAANEFYRKIEPILNNPANIALSGPKAKSSKGFFFRSKNRSKSVGRQASLMNEGSKKDGTLERFWNDSSAYGTTKGFKVPPKKEISAPCAFQHIASVNEFNCDEFHSAKLMLNPSGQAMSHGHSHQYSEPRAFDLQSTSDGNSVHYSSPEPTANSNGSPVGSFSDVGNVVVISHHSHHQQPDSSLSSSSNFSY